MFGKRKRKRIAVGVDIGNRAVKTVALETDTVKGKHRLVGYHVAATPGVATAMSDKALGDLVHAAVAKCPGDEHGVRASVSGNVVVVRYIRMPKMDLQELRSSIRYEAGQHIPFDVKEVELDCTILRAPQNGDGKMEVMLVAARKNACERVLNILKAAKLTANCIDVDPVATINAYLLSHPSDTDKPTALLNIGAKQTTVSILSAGIPAFTRCIEIGGEGLSLAIARGLGVELEEAERLKVFGDSLIQPHIEMVLNSIARQVRTSFDYFEGLAGRTVAALYVSGGTAKLDGIGEFLSEALGVPAHEWDPLEGIDTSDFATDDALPSLAPTLDVAVGLAARSVET
ncbi:MAG: type IV pilus assembly protein PilM [Verrucomicrobia bacterium]|nr:type IV pilus assembly protein PilM [Verrucomicrobiota bacterium]